MRTARKKKYATVLTVCAGIICAGVLVLRSCGMSAEERALVEGLNRYGPIIGRGGEVRRADILHGRDERIAFVESIDIWSGATKRKVIRGLKNETAATNDVPFRADILDGSGRVIGEARGYRVEGFGSSVLECVWHEDEAAGTAP
jgi:hypothetical protein